jgi:hypothetical protein
MKGVHRRESSEGRQHTLTQLPEALSELETASAAEALKLKLEDIAALYAEFRAYKNAYPRDWQHLARSELNGIFVTWIATSRQGKDLLRKARPAAMRDYSKI